MNGPFQVAQANIAGQPAGKPPARIVKIAKPFSEQSVVVALSYDGSVKADLSAIAGEKITLVHVGEKLIILFDNKSTITLEPFFDSTGKPLQSLTVEVSPGRDLTGTEFAALFPVTEDQSILPAAGDGDGGNAQASGANFSSVGVDPLALPGPLDLLGQEELPNFVITDLLTPVNVIDLIPSQIFGARVGGAVEEEQLGGFIFEARVAKQLFEFNPIASHGQEDPNDVTQPNSNGANPDGLDRDTEGNDNTTQFFHGAGANALTNLVAGGDGPLTFSIDGAIANSAVRDGTGAVVRSGGNDLHYSQVESTVTGDSTVIGGYGGGEEGFHAVFQLTIHADGTYDFTLFDKIDHPDHTVDTNSTSNGHLEETLFLDFTTLVHVSDNDGDNFTLTGTNAFTIGVIDDTPVVSVTASENSEGLALSPLDESILADHGLGNNGNGADDDTGNTAPDPFGINPIGEVKSADLALLNLFAVAGNTGEDGFGSVDYAFSLTLTGAGENGGVATSLSVTDPTKIYGNDSTIYLFNEGGEIVGRVGGADGAIALRISLDDAGNPAAHLVVDQYLPVDHGNDGNDFDSSLPLTLVGEGATLGVTFTTTVTDGDGDVATSSATVTIANGESSSINIEDDGPMVTPGEGGETTPLAVLNLDETIGADRYNTGESESGVPNGADDKAALVTVSTAPLQSEAIGELSTGVGALAGLFTAAGVDFGTDGPAAGGGIANNLTLVLSSETVGTNLTATALVGTPLENMLSGERAIQLVRVDDYTIEGRLVGDGDPSTGDQYVAFRITLENPSDPATAKITVDQFLAIDHGGSENPSVFDEQSLLTLIGGGTLNLQLVTTATDGDGDHFGLPVQVNLIGNENSFIAFDDDGPKPLSISAANGAANGLFFDGFVPNNDAWGAGSGINSSGTAGAWHIAASDYEGASTVQLERVGDNYRGSDSPTNSVMVDLEATPGNVQVSQNLTLISGALYHLTFEIGAANDPGVLNSAKIDILWNGVSVGQYTPAPGVMQTISIDVTAAGANNQLTFMEIGEAGDNTGTFLANVKLSDVIIIDETKGVDADSDDTATDLGALFATVTNAGPVGVDPDMDQPQYAQGQHSVVVLGTADYGTDGAAATDPVQIGLTVSVAGVDSGLTTTEGQAIHLYAEGALVVGRFDSDNNGTYDTAAFALSIDPDSGILSIAQYVSLHHPDIHSYDEGVYLAPGTVLATVTVTDGDGDHTTTSADVSSAVRFEDDGPSFLGVTPPGAVGPDLIQNGSFEDTTPSPLALPPIGQWAIYNQINHWDAAGGVPFEVQVGSVGGIDAQQGVVKIELDADFTGNPDFPAATNPFPDHTHATIQQTVSTVAGQTYELTFYYSARPDDGDGANSGMRVLWNGVEVYTINSDTSGWQKITLPLTGTGNDTIAFQATGPAAQENELGALIDNVSLFAVNYSLDDEGLSTLVNPGPDAIGIPGGPGDDPGAATVRTGSILFNAGADGLKSIQVGLTNTDLQAIHIDPVTGVGTAHDVKTVWVANGQGGTLTGYMDLDGSNARDAGDADVFTVVVQPNGSYTFTLLAPLAHSVEDDPATSAIETAFEDNLSLNFGVTITDGDDDTATGSLTFNVDDDSPEAAVSVATSFSVTLDESLLLQNDDILFTSVFSGVSNRGKDFDVPFQLPIGYARSDASALTVSGLNFGADGAASSNAKVYSLTLTGADGLPTTGPVDSGIQTTEHKTISLFVENGLIVGRYDGADAGTDVTDADPAAFAVAIDPATGVVSLVQYVSLFHSDPGDSDDAISLSIPGTGAISATLTVTDGDGDSASASAEIGGAIRFEDDGPHVLVTVKHGFGVTIDESNGTQANDVANPLAIFASITNKGADHDNADLPLAFATNSSTPALVVVPYFGVDGAATSGATVYSLTLNGANENGVASGLMTTAGQEIRLYSETYGTDTLIVGRVVGGGPDFDGKAAFALAIDPVSGKVSVVEYLSLQHNLNGLDPNDSVSLASGVVSATVTITDGDGDTASASADISGKIQFRDDGPKAISTAHVTATVDEDGLHAPGLSDSNLDGNPLRPGETDGSESAIATGNAGALNSLVNFGVDGPGSFGLKVQAASDSGLDSKGKNVFIVSDGSVLTGFVDTDASGGFNAGDREVFTLTVGSDGSYVFTLKDQIDHPPLNGAEGDNSENLLSGNGIDLSSFIVATDGDHDPVPLATGTFTVQVLDDIPVVTANPPETMSVPTSYTLDGVSGGHDLYKVLDGDGDKDILLSARTGNSPDAVNTSNDIGVGQGQNINGVDNNSAEEYLRIDFVHHGVATGNNNNTTYTATDHYSVNSLTFTVPQVQQGPASLFLQLFSVPAGEDNNSATANLNDNAFVAVSGVTVNGVPATLTAVYEADGTTLKGYLLEGVDQNDVIAITGASGFGRAVIANFDGVTINTGGSNTEVVDGAKSFSVLVSETGTLVSKPFEVRHDETTSPVLVNDTSDPNDADDTALALPSLLSTRISALGLTELGHAVGPNSLASLFTFSVGADEPGTIAYQLSTATANGTFNGVDSGLKTTIGGLPILLYSDPTNPQILWGVTGADFASGTKVFAAYADPDGHLWLTQFQAIAHDVAGNTPAAYDDIAFVALNLVHVTANLTDADGDTAAVVSGTPIKLSFQDDGPLAVNDIDSANGGALTATGNVITSFDIAVGPDSNITDGVADKVGTDGAKVSKIVGYAGSTDNTADSVTHDFVATGHYGTLTINENGSYTYTRFDGSPVVANDVFTYTLTDGDGDTSTATLTIGISDHGVTTTVPAAGTAGAQVFEAGLPARAGEPEGSNAAADSETTTGSITYTAPDGPAVVTIDGTAVTFVGQTFVHAGIGTLEVTSIATGSVGYKYTLADNTLTDPSSDSFAVVVTDADGDHDDKTLTIKIIDDVPHAANDANTVTEGLGHQTSGNVFGVAGASANDHADTIGADGAAAGGAVTRAYLGLEANAGSATYTTIAGATVVAGLYGNLTLNPDGTYTYALTTASIPVGVTSETFTYEIKDGDGDTDLAQLVIGLSQDTNFPDTTGATATVYEDGLADGVQHGATSEKATGTFTVDGNNETYTLTLDGDAGGPVTITAVGQTVTTSKGVLEITSISAPDAGGVVTYGYSYTLSHALTHTGQGEINPLSDTITMSVTDATGDSDPTPASIVISIVDDIPVAVNDANTVTEGLGHQTSGNVFGVAGASANDHADTIGADGAAAGGAVTRAYLGLEANAGSATYTTIAGATVVTGLYGNLTLNPDGTYTYALTTASIPVGVTSETFTYEIKDGDGDTDLAQLVIGLSQDTNFPDTTGATATVYEDGLADGVQHGATSETATGTFTVDGNNETYTLTLDGDAGGPVTITAVGQTVTTSKGVLEITSISAPDAGGVVTYGYSYTLSHALTHTGQGEINPLSDTITMSVTDATGDSDPTPASIVISIVDDVPQVAIADTPVSVNENATINNGAWSLIAGADGVTSVVVAVGASTQTLSMAAGQSVVFSAGLPGTLTIFSDLTWKFVAGSVNANTGVTFSITATDGDGDTSSDSQSFTVLNVNNLPTAGTATVLIDEEGLTNGIVSGPGDIPGQVITQSGFLPFTSADGLASTDPINFSPMDSGTHNTAVVTTGAVQVTSGGVALKYYWDSAGDTLYASTDTSSLANAQSSAAFKVALNTTTGAYTYTELKPLDHPGHDDLSTVGTTETSFEDNLNINLTYQVKDGTTPTADTATGTLSITINDDSPVAVSESASVNEGQKPTMNVVFVIDNSGSMGSGAGSRMELAKAAAINLLNNSSVDFNQIMVVSFASTATNNTPIWADKADAIAYIGGLSATDGTDYDAALLKVTSNWGSGPTPADQTVVYFISDGEPTEDNGTGTVGIVGTEQTNWEAFLASKSVTASYAVGISTGVNDADLTPISWAPGNPNLPPVIITNAGDLSTTLAGSLPGSVSGNILTNGDGFGADGGYVKSITVNGTTYTFNGNATITTSGNAPGAGDVINANGKQITIITDLGGKLVFNFAANGTNQAGEWDYTAPNNVPATSSETFAYTLIDGDGDTVGASLNLTVNNINAAPSGTNTALTVTEDLPLTFTAADFGFSDPGDTPANAFQAVKITTLETAGTLKLNGVDVTLGQVIDIAEINAGHLIFTGAQNGNGTGYATFTFQVQDNGGTANGGQNLDQTPNTMTINVTAVNDAPTAVADNYSTTKNATLTVGTALSVLSNDSDPDSSITALLNAGPAHGTVTLNANGTFTYIPDPGFVGTDSFTYHAFDGTLSSGIVTATITVADANIAPVVIAPDSLQYDPASGTDTTAFNHFMVADADTASLTVTLTRTGGDGTLSASSFGGVTVGGTSSALTLQGTADAINKFIAGDRVTLDTNGNDTDTFTISVNDGTTTTNHTGFAVDDFTPSFSGNSTNNLAGMNIYETSLDAGNSTDTVYTAWNHVNSAATAYIGGSGTDTIYLDFTGAQLQEILSGTTTRDNLQGFLTTPTGSTLDLDATSWNATASGFENANIELANLFSTTDSGTPSNNYVDINATWKSVISSSEIVGLNGTGNNDLVIANASGTVLGNNGNDVLVANNAGNTLDGGSGQDLLLGGTGSDILIGGVGADVLSGGAGADTFRWGAETAGTANADKILDYNFAEGDKLDLSSLLDANFVPGTTPINNFIQVQQSGNDIVVSVDSTGSHNFTASSAQAYTLVGLATAGPDPVKIYFEATDHTLTV